MTSSVERFEALASGPRLQILEALRDKRLRCEEPDGCDLSERCCNVGELADVLGLTQPTVSHHLKQLRRAGLVDLRKRGRSHYCALNDGAFEELANWIQRFRRSGGDGGCS